MRISDGSAQLGSPSQLGPWMPISASMALKQPKLGGKEPAPEQCDGHARQHGRQIEGRPVEAQQPDIGIEQERQPQPEADLKRDADERIDGGDLERFPDQVVGEHRRKVLHADKLRRGDQVPVGEGDKKRCHHRTYRPEQEAEDPGRGKEPAAQVASQRTFEGAARLARGLPRAATPPPCAGFSTRSVPSGARRSPMSPPTPRTGLPTWSPSGARPRSAVRIRFTWWRGPPRHWIPSGAGPGTTRGRWRAPRPNGAAAGPARTPRRGQAMNVRKTDTHPDRYPDHAGTAGQGAPGSRASGPRRGVRTGHGVLLSDPRAGHGEQGSGFRLAHMMQDSSRRPATAPATHRHPRRGGPVETGTAPARRARRRTRSQHLGWGAAPGRL